MSPGFKQSYKDFSIVKELNSGGTYINPGLVGRNFSGRIRVDLKSSDTMMNDIDSFFELLHEKIDMVVFYRAGTQPTPVLINDGVTYEKLLRWTIPFFAYAYSNIYQ